MKSRVFLMLAIFYSFALQAEEFSLPVQQKEGWELLTFKSLPGHKVNFDSSGLKVEVSKSASPIIFPLKQAMDVSSIKVVGQLSKLLQLPEGKKQGDKGVDDFVLRVGLVVEGKKRLSWVQRQVAPQWVLKLHALAPKDKGIDRIEFLVADQTGVLKGSSRTHPLSDLLIEKFVWSLPKAGDFALDYTYAAPVRAGAIWLSIDGDDTKSDYQLILSKIVLNEDTP